MGATDAKRWKVGEVAKATGLTVRALHHYDELGLLVPSERTPAGHRLYAGGDLRRLYRILALRQVGLPLTEIDSVIDDEGAGLIETVRRQLERMDRDLERGQRLRQSLVRILDALERALDPSIDQFIDAMEAMTMIETTVADVVARVPHEEPDGVAVLGVLAGMVDKQLGSSIPLGHPSRDCEVEIGIESRRPLSSAGGNGVG